MLWTLYSQWRFRSISPAELWNRSGLPALWPSRVTAVEEAFAIHAAELERTTVDVLDALGDALR